MINKETVLIVDDEKEISDLIEIYLKNDGYNVLKAYNGLEAIKILEENEVHLIILDIMMPKMDGIQACMKIRKKKYAYNHVVCQSQDMDKIIILAPVLMIM